MDTCYCDGGDLWLSRLIVIAGRKSHIDIFMADLWGGEHGKRGKRDCCRF